MKKTNAFVNFLFAEYAHPVICEKVLIIFSVVISLLLLSVHGCAQKQQRMLQGKSTQIARQYSKEELRESLDRFDNFASAVTAEVARQIEEKEPDFRTRKLNLVQQTQTRQAVRTMLEQEDPIVAFIEAWSLCVRLTNYLTSGEGSNLFREHQDIAIIASEKLQNEIEMIGRKYFQEDVFAQTQKNIYNFAEANPIKGTFSNIIVYATKVRPGQSALFDEVIGIPMSPFKAMSGVDRTASAIYGLGESADRISDVVEELPESVRWQLLLLLMEMQETEMVISVLKSMSKLSDSSVRFADSAEKLPEQLRQQLSILLEEIDEKQVNLQTTLEKAEKTSVSVEQALVQADKVAVSFQSTANDVNQVATAWEKAANATSEALAEINIMRTPRKGAAPKAPFNINDYRDTAETVAVTVNELRTLIADVREFVASDDLAGSSFAAQQWTNHLAWRIGQLLFLVFVLALVYKIVVIRIVVKKKSA
ncbi:MAG: hypothetical protein ACYTFW_16060 [Planctomycetota bacterium]|jgi:hypothetical protein